MFQARDLIRAGVDMQVRKSLSGPLAELVAAIKNDESVDGAIDSFLTGMSGAVSESVFRGVGLLGGGDPINNRKHAREWGVSDEVLGDYPPRT